MLIYIVEGRFDAAELALQRLRPAGWSVADELDEMKTTLAAESRLQSGVGYRTLFQNPIDRRRTILSVLGLTTQAASGAMFVICKSFPPDAFRVTTSLTNDERTVPTFFKWPT